MRKFLRWLDADAAEFDFRCIWPKEKVLPNGWSRVMKYRSDPHDERLARKLVMAEHPERSLTERPNEQADEGCKHRSQVANQLNGFPHIAALTEHPERSAHERVLSALRAKDGVLFGSQWALGRSFGWSKTRMNEVLHELQAVGRVRLAVSRQGTMVRLVCA